jgi:hypothetical protein
MVIRSAAEVELEHLLHQPIYHQKTALWHPLDRTFYEPNFGLER